MALAGGIGVRIRPSTCRHSKTFYKEEFYVPSHTKLRNVSLISALLLGLGLIAAGPALAYQQGDVVSVPFGSPILTLNRTGYKLLLSNSPETFTTTGAFYRDSVSSRFRVYYHHQSNVGYAVSVAVAITNKTAQTLDLYLNKRGAATNLNPAIAGKTTLYDWFASSSTDYYIATLAPGATHYLAQSLANGYTASGMYDLVAVYKSDYSVAPVTVTVLAYTTAPSDPTQTAVLPKQSGVSRGTFNFTERTGTFAYGTQEGNRYLDVAGPISGQYSNAMSGEYEAGTSAVDGNEIVFNNGNYGVVYKLTVKLTNDGTGYSAADLLANPAGGESWFILKRDGNLLVSPRVIQPSEAWVFYKTALSQGASVTVNLEMSLAGGSSGPMRLYFTPDN